MSKRGVSLLSTNSLAALSKVCLPSSSSDSFKTLPLLRTISTAAERSDFPSSNGYSFDYPPDDNFQTRGSSYGESQYSSDLAQNPYGKNLNPNAGFRESHRNEIGIDPVGKFGDLQRNLDANYQIVTNGNQKNPVENNGKLWGNHGYNTEQFQQSYGESSAQNRFLQDKPNGLYGGSIDAVNSYRPAGFDPNKTDAYESEQKSAESSSDNPNIGTLEQLDDYCKEGKVKEAVEVLQLLEKQDVHVDLPRLLRLIGACGKAGALMEAKAVHDYIVRFLSPLKVSTNNRIIEMYSKCGSMDDALNVFNNMQERNLTSWDKTITWLAKNELGEDAIDLFSQFKEAGHKPDAKMFIAVFSACSVLGDVTEGMLHFESMTKDYGIVPSMQHHMSIVHMLGSNGYLDEALEFIGKMPVEPTVDIWETLMNLCRIQGHTELGDRCAEIVEQLDASRLNEQSRAGLLPENAMEFAKDKEKMPIRNILEVRSKVHEYRAGDTSHPDSAKHYALLRGLKQQMKEAGYIPETRFVLHDIDQESKEDALLSHSERLATAHGLLTSPARSNIRVIKNLRVCVDCHNALKIISKIVGRELIMRDSKRFHHLKDGVCTCRDYW